MSGPEIHTAPSAFADLYLRVREKEKRILSDEEVFLLPDTLRENPHAGEWELRKDAMSRLIKYFKNKKQALTLLEVGCGNGWLAHRLSLLHPISVTGLDVNETELKQAARVFAAITNLDFYHGSIDDLIVSKNRFDVILFAASIQYFPSLAEILHKAMQLLQPGGEIHILDSPFYDMDELQPARQRTRQYYDELGFPGMATFYFHHCKADLKNFRHYILHKPGSMFNLFRENKNPFPWYCIKK